MAPLSQPPRISQDQGSHSSCCREWGQGLGACPGQAWRVPQAPAGGDSTCPSSSPRSQGGPALPGRGTVGPPPLLRAFPVWQRPQGSSLPAGAAVASVVWLGHGREPRRGHPQVSGGTAAPRPRQEEATPSASPGSNPTLPSLHRGTRWAGALLGGNGGVSRHFSGKQPGFRAGVLGPLSSPQATGPALPRAHLPPPLPQPWPRALDFGTGWDPDGGGAAPGQSGRPPFQAPLLPGPRPAPSIARTASAGNRPAPGPRTRRCVRVPGDAGLWQRAKARGTGTVWRRPEHAVPEPALRGARSRPSLRSGRPLAKLAATRPAPRTPPTHPWRPFYCPGPSSPLQVWKIPPESSIICFVCVQPRRVISRERNPSFVFVQSPC